MKTEHFYFLLSGIFGVNSFLALCRFSDRSESYMILLSMGMIFFMYGAFNSDIEYAMKRIKKLGGIKNENTKN